MSSVFKSLNGSLEGNVVCQVEKQGDRGGPGGGDRGVSHRLFYQQQQQQQQQRNYRSESECPVFAALTWRLPCLSFLFNVMRNALCGLPGARSPNCWKARVPMYASHMSAAELPVHRLVLSSATVYPHQHLHAAVRTKGCPVTLDSLHFEHVKEMGKTWRIWKEAA